MLALVTGATGFLGNHLCRELREIGYAVHISNTQTASLSDIKNLDVYKDIDFDIIFHLAAVTKAGDWCVHNSGTQWIENQTINTNILKFWKEYQPSAKMVCIGTSCSYDPTLPLEEGYYEKGMPDLDLYYYAQTKRMLLTGLRALEKQYGLEWLYVIPSTLYGPGFKDDDNHFIFDLVRKISDGKYKDSPVTLWGTGEQKRELINVKDFVNILIGLTDRKNEVINIGRGKEYSIKEYARKICQLVGFDFYDIKYDTAKFSGVQSKCLNVEKLKGIFPKLKFTPLEEGLKEIIDWNNNGKKIFTNTV